METLTSELVDKAWTLFLEIQSTGGYEAFITSGRLESLLEKRKGDVSKGNSH